MAFTSTLFLSHYLPSFLSLYHRPPLTPPPSLPPVPILTSPTLTIGLSLPGRYSCLAKGAIWKSCPQLYPQLWPVLAPQFLAEEERIWGHSRMSLCPSFCSHPYSLMEIAPHPLCWGDCELEAVLRLYLAGRNHPPGVCSIPPPALSDFQPSLGFHGFRLCSLHLSPSEEEGRGVWPPPGEERWAWPVCWA